MVPPRVRDAKTAAEAVARIVFSALGMVSLMSLLLVDPHAHGWSEGIVIFVESRVSTFVYMSCFLLSMVYWLDMGPLCGISDGISLMSAAWGAALVTVYHCVCRRNFPSFSLLLLSAHAAFHVELFTSWHTSLFEWIVAAATQQGN